MKGRLGSLPDAVQYEFEAIPSESEAVRQGAKGWREGGRAEELTEAPPTFPAIFVSRTEVRLSERSSNFFADSTVFDLPLGGNKGTTRASPNGRALPLEPLSR